MTTKLYKVQTWDTTGKLTNHYEVQLDGATALKSLRTFLKSKFTHVEIVAFPSQRKTRG